MTYEEAYDYFNRAYKYVMEMGDTKYFTDDHITIALVHRKIPRINIFSLETNNSVQLRLDESMDFMQMLRSIRVARSIVL